jgi:hypothetical protein
MTTIYAPMIPKILHVQEFWDEGKRYRWTRTAMTKTDGDIHIHDEFEEVTDVGNLLFIPGGPDVDAIAVRDLTQMAKEKTPKPREHKPDIVKMYGEFNERRRWELAGNRVYPVLKVSNG